jgi:creatinine amidohydrolase
MIQDITFEQARGLINENTIVMLPVGGGSKEHGNHLPMGTDYYVTDWVARKVTADFPLLCLPTLPYAHFPAFVEWKGSVSVEAMNFINFVKDILLSFVRFGVKKFVILDGGISTRPPMIILSTIMNNDYGVKVAVTNVAGLGKEVHDAVCEQERGGHGDEGETSCMLYINDSLVHMDKTVEEYTDVLEGTVRNGVQKVYVPHRMATPTGTNGNSTLATREKGEKILNAMVNDLLTFLQAFAHAQFADS